MAMDLRLRRWMAVGALALVGTTSVAGGAVAQVPPSSSTTTSSTTTSSTAPTTTAPIDPPDLMISLTYGCPASGGPGVGAPVPVSQIGVQILNRGGPIEVDLVLDGTVVRRNVEVPFSYLGVPQLIWLALPEGDPNAGLTVDVVGSDTGRPLGGAGMSNRPSCESLVQFEAPAATPTEAMPTFTG